MQLKDPFPLMEDQIRNKIQQIHQAHGTGNTSQFHTLVSSIRDDLDDLEHSIHVVEQYPSKYPLESKDLQRRKDFIRTMRKMLPKVETGDHLACKESEQTPFLPCRQAINLSGSQVQFRDINLDEMAITIQAIKKQSCLINKELKNHAE